MNNHVTFKCMNCDRKPFILKEDFKRLYKKTYGHFCSIDCFASYSITDKCNSNRIKTTKSETSLSNRNEIKKPLVKSN